MGKRREPRHEIRVPVRIFGTDSNGQVFSEKVFTANVSRSGVELSNVQAQLKLEEIVGLTYGNVKGHFRVKWVGANGTPRSGHAGLLNLSPEKALWDFPLPAPAIDGSPRDMHDRRKYPRLKCVTSVEIYPSGQNSPIRVRTADLSLGGCFVEMPNPMPKGADINIALWVKDIKLWAKGKVVTSTPGFGIGVQFTELSNQDKTQLQLFLESISRLPI